jgi:glycosyltransferase involved in cell wall biosynthesis
MNAGNARQVPLSFPSMGTRFQASGGARVFAVTNVLTDHLPHGDGLIAWQYLNRLVRRGIEIDVTAYAVSLKGDPPSGMRVHPFRVNAPTTAGRSLQGMFKVAALYRRLSRSTRFDLIHQLNPVTDPHSALLPTDRVPLILGPCTPRWPVRKAPGRFRKAVRLLPRALVNACLARQERTASIMLLTSPAALAGMQHKVIPSERLVYLPFGVDTKVFRPAADTEIPRLPTVLFLGVLREEKGIHTLLDAFDRVAEAVPEARLEIAGDGPEFGAVRRRVLGSSWANRVSMLGNVARNRVPEAMRDCTVYCLPSHGDPFPQSALEAMACGKPLVATEAGGLGYIVDAPRGGRMVAVGAADALARALIEILAATPEARASMGNYNRELAVGRYDWEILVARLERVYAQAVQRLPGKSLVEDSAASRSSITEAEPPRADGQQ